MTFTSQACPRTDSSILPNNICYLIDSRTNKRTPQILMCTQVVISYSDKSVLIVVNSLFTVKIFILFGSRLSYNMLEVSEKT
jgi:hypothetical protein